MLAGQPPPSHSLVLIIQSRVVNTALSKSHRCRINLLLIGFFDLQRFTF